ncbi:putative transcription factor ovo-like protein 3 [Narcine bancroftii]|uniref:putative transcription factor ovo-like protein 3 n=1 Tax=Narcine bancroftii TaxID=1343680 RepID=UPI0038315EA2
MPRSFLVKKRASGCYSWDHVSDNHRGDFYVPGCSIAQSLPKQAESIDKEGIPPNLSARSVEEKLYGVDYLETAAMIRRPKMKSTCNQGQFVCLYCWKVFSFQHLLIRHLKSHSLVKKHICGFCRKGFNDTFDLKRHMRTHTGVRPYKCDLCEKAFTQRCSLESHLKKIHNVHQNYAFRERRSKIFVCEDCGFTSSQGDAYFAHIRDHHPSSPVLSKYLRKQNPSFQKRIGMLLFPHYV